MKKKILLLFYILCYHLGIIAFFYYINRNKQRILVFHHIIPDKYINSSFEQDIVCTSYSKFAWIMSIVNRRFKVTTELGMPDTVVITFDDGYRAALIADEVLDKEKNEAYFFIPLTNVEAGPLWIDQIMAWFAYVPAGSYLIGEKKVNLCDKFSRQSSFSAFIDDLYEKEYDKEKLIRILDNLYPYVQLPIEKEYWDLRFRGLNKEEIDILKKKGHKFGGHSINHDILSLLDKNVLKRDFNVCSKQIGGLFNTDLYAYPFGHKRDVTPVVAQVCKDSEFTHAVLNEYNPKASDYSLSRLNISHYTSRYEIEASLSGLTQAIKKLLRCFKNN